MWVELLADVPIDSDLIDALEVSRARPEGESIKRVQRAFFLRHVADFKHRSPGRRLLRPILQYEEVR